MAESRKPVLPSVPPKVVEDLVALGREQGVPAAVTKVIIRDAIEEAGAPEKVEPLVKEVLTAEDEDEKKPKGERS